MHAAPTILTSGKEPTAVHAVAGNWHIHLQGRVQGVGFRPYVFNLATQWKLEGKVQNGLDGLHIWLYATKNLAHTFYQQVLQQPPHLAIITHSTIQPSCSEPYIGFTINTDGLPAQKPNLWITPDLATCPTCLHEMNDAANRRHKYAFITCTQCGPRYSIMEALPFERHLTTMQPFHLCRDCEQEFSTPSDSRFFAQTISCETCGIKMDWLDSHCHPINLGEKDIIAAAADAMQKGKILAVKGIGGFLLMADAANETTIAILRERKNRPAKPLAVMYPSLELLSKHAPLKQAAIQQLTTAQAPIVLVNISPAMQAAMATNALAPGLNNLGVMLPYAPLLHLLARAFGKPMVATSGNISGAPVCFTNLAAEVQLKGLADFYLMHNRSITAPQDDSLVCIPEQLNEPILLRRSRGYAPACEGYKPQTKRSILATGALVKSTFAIAHAQRVYVSQYLGNTESYEAQLSYRHTCHHLLHLLQMDPELVVVDKHPAYFAHTFGQQIAADMEVPLHTVQHHKAHFAAVLAEHNLLDNATPILGVIWDGTGLGDDGQSWGGEFFTYERGTVKRNFHFDYFPHLLGDKMAREPRLSALATLHNIGLQPTLPAGMFSPVEADLYNRMLLNYHGVKTSSVGRLFDAVAACVLGFGIQSYEGEAAMQLEAAARQWLCRKELKKGDSYFSSMAHNHLLPTHELMQAIVQDINKGYETGYMAAKFHYSLVLVINWVATQLQVQHIACSGGVFQNSLLVDMLVHHLGNRYKLYFNRQLPPNDENISFGQLVWVDRGIG